MKQRTYETPKLTRYGDFSMLTRNSRTPAELPRWIDPLGPMPEIESVS